MAQGQGSSMLSPAGSLLGPLPSPGPSISLLDMNSLSPSELGMVPGLGHDLLPVNDNPTVSSPEQDDSFCGGMELPFDFVNGLTSMGTEDLGLSHDDFKDDLWQHAFSQAMQGGMGHTHTASASVGHDL